ncbi:MAG: ATP-binding cassette domain-containing protein [Lachnospiraceae bacterium]|nr:ATP-binding cassette domain-containing protein [Lachnospiraceae bacterium]
MTLEINDIRKKYGKKTVLDGINLSADVGSCVGILGGNGCGKSTLLSIIAGLSRADSGSVTAVKDNGKAVIGYVPQGTPLMEELSAWDNLRLWYSRDALKRELESGVLKMLGIDTFLKVPVRKMSMGMKKRLSIGCAVYGNPDILLLDEPTAALDIVCKESIYAYIDDFRKKGGIVLFVTHDVHEFELCDICYVMKDGRLSEYTYDGDLRKLAGMMT